MKTEPNNTEIIVALDACLEIMTRAIGESLPVRIGSDCEEEDWKTAIRKARNALCGEVFDVAVFYGEKYTRAVINKDGRVLAIQFTSNNVRDEVTRQLIESNWIARDNAHRARFNLKFQKSPNA